MPFGRLKTTTRANENSYPLSSTLAFLAGQHSDTVRREFDDATQRETTVSLSNPSSTAEAALHSRTLRLRRAPAYRLA